MMFELKNKVPRDSTFLHSEGVLTGTIFGYLRYFNNQNILLDFLVKSIDLQGNPLKISCKKPFSINFWKKYYNDSLRRYNEPDLTLENDKYAIIIECKYRSPLSEEYEIIEDKEKNYTNQLIRYSNILCDIAEFNKKEKIVIFLTDDKSFPRDILIKSRKDINKNIGLYWLSWNKLYLVLSKININSFNENEKLLINDLNTFLIKRNLVTFEKFVIDDIKFTYHYQKYYKYIKSNYDIKWNYNRNYNFINKENILNWRYKK